MKKTIIIVIGVVLVLAIAGGLYFWYAMQQPLYTPGMVREGAHCDVVVLDPPRKGAGPIVVTAATRLRPKRILLISCHPATLARDLKTLAEHGYVPRCIQPIDMFPHTWHVEAVALCEPKG